MYQTEALEDLDEAKPNRCRSCLYHTWKIFTCIFSHIILVSMVVAYCILGAFTFEQLESKNEVVVSDSLVEYFRFRNGTDTVLKNCVEIDLESKQVQVIFRHEIEQGFLMLSNLNELLAG